MSEATFASPHRRLNPITRRQNPQVLSGLYSRGGSFRPDPNMQGGPV